jgi:hypothetical protein
MPNLKFFIYCIIEVKNFEITFPCSIEQRIHGLSFKIFNACKKGEQIVKKKEWNPKPSEKIQTLLVAYRARIQMISGGYLSH